jgi:hypothetical protein
MNKFRKLGFIEYNGGLRVRSSPMNLLLPGQLATSMFQPMFPLKHIGVFYSEQFLKGWLIVNYFVLQPWWPHPCADGGHLLG